MIDFLLAILMKIHQKNIIQLFEEKKTREISQFGCVYIIYKIKNKNKLNAKQVLSLHLKYPNILIC